MKGEKYMKKFNKILGIILVGIMVITAFGACGGEEKAEKKVEKKADFETLKAEYQEMDAEALIKKHIKDRKNPTEDEIAALLRTSAYAQVNERHIFDENITTEALDILNGEQVELSYIINNAKLAIDDEDPMVRAYVYSQFSEYVPLDDEELEDFLLEKIKKETETVVVANALRGLANALSERTEFADFAISYAENEDPAIRYWVAYALGFYRLEDNEKCVDVMIKLMGDTDPDVAELACAESGSFYNDKIVEPLSAILADEAKLSLHGAATDALADLWLDFPFYENKSEAAYRAHIAYLNTSSQNPEIPSWLSVASITEGSGDSFENWKTTTPYYNPAELVGALSNIVANKNVDKLTKTTAIQRIGCYGTAADLEALKGLVAGDGEETALIEAIDSEIASLG